LRSIDFFDGVALALVAFTGLDTVLRESSRITRPSSVIRHATLGHFGVVALFAMAAAAVGSCLLSRGSNAAFAASGAPLPGIGTIGVMAGAVGTVALVHGASLRIEAAKDAADRTTQLLCGRGTTPLVLAWAPTAIGLLALCAFEIIPALSPVE